MARIASSPSVWTTVVDRECGIAGVVREEKEDYMPPTPRNFIIRLDVAGKTSSLAGGGRSTPNHNHAERDCVRGVGGMWITGIGGKGGWW
jgi:hypothetical protein